MKTFRAKSPDEFPPRRKEISDYSIRVIGVFSDTLVDYIYYNYHKEEWSFFDDDSTDGLVLQYWIEEVKEPENPNKGIYCKSCGKELEEYAIRETGLCTACFTSNA